MMKHQVTFVLILCASVYVDHANAQNWVKHVIMEQGRCNTAVALDANGDKHLDVIASFNGRISLFIAPDWKTEVILHRFASRGGCIHSATLDVDGDGDLDWAGTLASAHPFWLENPGKVETQKGAWTPREIDPEIMSRALAVLQFVVSMNKEVRTPAFS